MDQVFILFDMFPDVSDSCFLNWKAAYRGQLMG